MGVKAMRNSAHPRGIGLSSNPEKSMRFPRLLGLAAALAVFSACAETPAEPQPLEPDQLAIAAKPGNGAIVQRSFFDGVGVATFDFQSGLVAFNYANSDGVAPFIGCTPPSFHGGVNQLQVFTPSGKEHDEASGEVYVIVFDLAGFTGFCGQGLAEGPIRIHANFHLPNGPILFSSDGVIRSNVDGSDVRLHMSAQLDGTFNQVHGTVTLH
jgi:hypothetical protein